MIPTAETLQRAQEILQRLQELRTEFAGLFGATSEAPATPKRRGRPPGKGKAKGKGKRRNMSPEARARIAAAAKARWAKYRAEKK